jgi:threonyl-tRNA synthetase
VEVDDSNDSLGDKVRTAITQKHPAVIVVGDADVEGRTVGLRFYGEDGDIRGVPLDEAEKSLVEKAARPGE